MSIQDESFPADEFFDELDFSLNKSPRYQFPHLKRETLAKAQAQPTPNTSSSYSNESQNLSNQSSNGRAASVLSAKTSASDPTGLEEESSKPDFAPHTAQNKAVSYHDIHSQYTKRRFKHVSSKVGQYIADMKAEEQKRRNSAKFQRHQSLPEALASTGALQLHTGTKRKVHILSADELRKMDESISDEAEIDCSENTTRTTSGSSSSQGRHESSDDAGTSACYFIDKMAYTKLLSENERIQSYSDYLQTKLDEKSGEIIRLKHNVDFLRIELTNCQDKLKRQLSQAGGTMGMGLYSGMGGSMGGLGTGSRQSIQALLYCQAKSTKATQTEVVTPKSPSILLPLQSLLSRDIYATPDTPDANNNFFDSGDTNVTAVGSTVARNAGKGGKTVATIQPLSLNFSNITEAESNPESEAAKSVLRQRTSSNTTGKSNNNNNNNNNNRNEQHSRNSYPSSSDSAIDIESAEPPSPRPNVRKAHSSPAKLGQYLSANAGGSVAAGSSADIGGEEFVYYDKRNGCYVKLQAINITAPSNGYAQVAATDVSTSTDGSTNTADGRKAKKYSSLRRRWLRFLAPCARCKDANHSVLDGSTNSNVLQQTYTQIPLLEKSFANDCRNVR